MGTHFNLVAASSPSVWERLLAAEDELRSKWSWPARESDEGPDMQDVFAPWSALLDRGCRSALGDFCLNESERIARLDAFLAEGEWYSWIPCYAYGNSVTHVFLVERRAGKIVESRAKLVGRWLLIRKDPNLKLRINEWLGIPVT